MICVTARFATHATSVASALLLLLRCAAFGALHPFSLLPLAMHATQNVLAVCHPHPSQRLAMSKHTCARPQRIARHASERSRLRACVAWRTGAHQKRVKASHTAKHCRHDLDWPPKVKDLVHDQCGAQEGSTEPWCRLAKLQARRGDAARIFQMRVRCQLHHTCRANEPLLVAHRHVQDRVALLKLQIRWHGTRAEGAVSDLQVDVRRFEVGDRALKRLGIVG